MSFLRQEVPVWAFILIILLLGGSFIFVFSNYQTRIYNYQLLIEGGEEGERDFRYGSWPALSNPNFFASVKQNFLDQDVSFIEANLSEMKLRLYEKGKLAQEVDILSKGKEGSWWETPAGLYKVQLKKPTHFSSFGQVYQPWSMVFQGNFFIHGWPHYPSGEPVAEGYSGGCIRLSNEDAEAIYKASDEGIPVLVFESDLQDQDANYTLSVNGLSAQSALAGDLGSNFVFLSTESEIVQPIGGLTKLMTALIAAEYTNLDHEVTVSASMLQESKRPRLYTGQRISAYQLFFPLLMEDSNEAAFALAAFQGTERFVRLMNAKAQALGLINTHFVDPAGIEVGNVSTAEDIFHLLRYLLNNRSFLLKVSSGDLTQSIYGAPAFSSLRNFNRIDGSAGFVGGLLGESTAALVYTIDFDSKSGDIVFISLQSSKPSADVLKMKDWVESSYTSL